MLMTDFPNYNGLVSYLALKEMGYLPDEDAGSEAKNMTEEELQVAREEISAVRSVEAARA